MVHTPPLSKNWPQPGDQVPHGATAWTVFTNANLFFDKKKSGKYKAKLTYLWYDNFSRSLHRNGMAAIPKIMKVIQLWSEYWTPKIPIHPKSELLLVQFSNGLNQTWFELSKYGFFVQILKSKVIWFVQPSQNQTKMFSDGPPKTKPLQLDCF